MRDRDSNLLKILGVEKDNSRGPQEAYRDSGCSASMGRPNTCIRRTESSVTN
jgi:hypothetical protein